jgi:hypothetical protein
MKNKKVLLVVIAAELTNALLSYLIGRSQANQCPRDTTLPLISGLLSLIAVAALLILAIRSYKSRKWSLFIADGMGCILLIGIGFVLWFMAYGGLNWCNFNF